MGTCGGPGAGAFDPVTKIPIPTTSPSLGGVLTIGSFSMTLSGNYYGEIFSSVEIENGTPGLTSRGIQVSSEGNLIKSTASFQLINFANPLPLSLTDPSVYHLNPIDDYANGFFVLTTLDGTLLAQIFFLADTVTVEEIGATPLPAALPLFATGLGVMSWFGRRHRRKSAAEIAA